LKSLYLILGAKLQWFRQASSRLKDPEMISRREFVAGAAAAAGSLAFQSNTQNSDKGKRPNLVYVFADQLRYASCGYAGDEYARTPNMDLMASQGCNLHQAITSTPVCAPYRASLMTGKYQSSTGMVINEIRLSPEHECFGYSLTKAGYKTAYIGKWHLWANQLGHHNLIKNGFVPPGQYRLGFDGFWEGYNFNHFYFRSPYFKDTAEPHIRKQYEPDEQTDVAINFLKEAAKNQEPFALFLSWGPPHSPWGQGNVHPHYAEMFRNIDIPLSPNYTNTPDPYVDAWQKLPPNFDNVVHDEIKAYYAQVANLDWNLGRLMKTLNEQGMADNTILVFTSDHGEMFGSHGRHGKLIFYEEAAHIPFLIRWPGKIQEKTVSDALLGTPDIMPTILSLMDIAVPSGVEGQDLSKTILGTKGSGPDVAHMQGMGATAAWADGSEWRGLRDNEYTYGIYHRDRKELLFNHRKDPYQLINLAEERSNATMLTHYRTISENWRKEQNDTFESCSWYQRWTEDRNITMTARGVKQDLQHLKELTDKWFPDGIGEHPVGDMPVGT
jgi:arylsulfatase A-like enzyme